MKEDDQISLVDICQNPGTTHLCPKSPYLSNHTRYLQIEMGLRVYRQCLVGDSATILSDPSINCGRTCNLEG